MTQTPRVDFSDVKFLGAATLGIIGSLGNKQVLLDGFSRKDDLATVRADEYHDLNLYVELVEYLENKLGRDTLFRYGRGMAQKVIAASFSDTINTVSSAIAEIQKAHEKFCVPTVGGFEIVTQKDGLIKLKYTAPYHCVLQEALFVEVAQAYGGRAVSVTHQQCRKDNYEACLFIISYIT